MAPRLPSGLLDTSKPAFRLGALDTCRCAYYLRKQATSGVETTSRRLELPKEPRIARI